MVGQVQVVILASTLKISLCKRNRGLALADAGERRRGKASEQDSQLPTLVAVAKCQRMESRGQAATESGDMARTYK